jgi:hypothetical protein
MTHTMGYEEFIELLQTMKSLDVFLEGEPAKLNVMPTVPSLSGVSGYVCWLFPKEDG